MNTSELRLGNLVKVTFNKGEVGYGKSGNLRYYAVEYMRVRLDRAEQFGKKIYVDYIASDAEYRVVPVDIDRLESGLKEQILELKDTLIEKELI